MPSIHMPKISDDMVEGTIIEWLKPDGAFIERGEELVEIEVDKISFIYEAEERGILRHRVAPGDTVSIGNVIAELDV